MKLLITGGCGFLGSNLAAHALKSGYDLVVFDNLYRAGSLENLTWLRTQGAFNFIHGDIRNSNDILRAVKEFKPDSIFHLAGQVAMTTSIANPRMDFEVNAMGTFNLLEAVREHAPEAAVVYYTTKNVNCELEQYQYKESKNPYV
jgi:CDP-paratose 2-epimerase